MRDGFVKVAAVTPEIRVADCGFNGTSILNRIKEAEEAGVKVLVFPELCVTGYTCGDLFLQSVLTEGAEAVVAAIASQTVGSDMLIFLGAPVIYGGKLFNAAVAVSGGSILGIIPKTEIPNYSEYYEARHFTSARVFEDDNPEEMHWITYAGQTDVLFGTKILFRHQLLSELAVACEICEDLWVGNPPSNAAAAAGATVICNLSASVEVTAKESYRRNLVKMQSAKTVTAYLYADAGEGESTTDVVFSGHNMICEYGTMLAESERFTCGMIVAEVDVKKLAQERKRMNTFHPDLKYWVVEFGEELASTKLTRKISPTPFIPQDEKRRRERCEEIFMLQAMGLKKRIAHTHAETAVIGLSGGLDSTLALLVTSKAFDLLGLSRKGILAVTMPGFGTTDRTYQNALTLAGALGTELREISIKDSVLQHFEDIGQDPDKHDVTYENSQARERTQILMDLANQQNGLVVGTGDLSELALGWATYNGDHMSMYGVNASVPKTLVRHLVAYVADEEESIREVLLDILDTPVSPELLPPEEDGTILQKTEDLVGPYLLHDFFLYYMMRYGYSPKKIYRIALYAFEDRYEGKEILAHLETFYKRFFMQQFKRSCIPDGPKVGSVSLSPRGDFRMPSDACVTLWMEELKEI